MFENPFSFIGRIGKREFAISFVIFLAVAIMSSVLSSLEGTFMKIVSSILYLGALYFLLAQGCKRSHDIGNSGWYQLIPFYHIYLLFADGADGDNEYGADPRVFKGSHSDKMEN